MEAVSNYISLIDELEQKTFRKSFTQIMEGIHSSSLTYAPFSFGNPVLPLKGNVFRRFYYNGNGEVNKKYSYDSEGNIEMKEQYEFTDKGKIINSKFTSTDSIVHENYYYEKDKIKEYNFINHKWSRAKKEIYEYDKVGRKLKKTNFGLLGTEELITEYFYDGSAKRYNFRRVSNPDGTLIMTFYFTYDTKDNITGMYGFYLNPDEISALIKQEKGGNQWELVSKCRSVWVYEDGNPVAFKRDEISHGHPFLNFGIVPNQDNRIVTQQSSSKFEKIAGKDHLIETTEYQTWFDEPSAVKLYSYYDKSGKVIYQHPALLVI
jgi:hypothetical protein